MVNTKILDLSGVIDLTLSDSDGQDPLDDGSDFIEEISTFSPGLPIKHVDDGPVIKEEQVGGELRVAEAGLSYKRDREATLSRSPNKSKRTKTSLAQGEKEESLGLENHEEAMKRAAEERRRTSSASSSKGITSAVNAIAGPGPQTLAQRDPTNAAVAVSQSSPAPLHPSVPPVACPTSGRMSPVAQLPGDPGSMGRANPIVADRIIDRSRAPSKSVSAPAPGEWGNPVRIGSGSGTAREASSPTVGTDSARPRIPISASSIRRAQNFLPHAIPDVSLPLSLPSPRKGPTWATSAVAEAIEQTPDVPAVVSETTADLAMSKPEVPTNIVAGQDGIISGERHARSNSVLAQEVLPKRESPSVKNTRTIDDTPLPQPTVDDSTDVGYFMGSLTVGTRTYNITADLPLAGPHNAHSADTESDANGRATSQSLPVSSVPQIQTVDQAIEDAIRDMGAREREMEEIARLLERAPSAETDDSIMELPAEVAKSQTVFKGRISIQPSSTDLANVTTIKSSDTLAVSTGLSINGIALAPVPPHRLPFQDMLFKREGSASTSASASSPSKRQSNRLAARTEVPVYSFKRNTYEPIQWRQTVELDGEPIDVLLRQNVSSPSETSTSHSTIMINGTEHTVIKTYDMPILDTPTPPERVSRALRRFDTRLIDKWNQISPTLTRNPDLHRLIFQSHIEASVGGQEPPINVSNEVDVEAIPPNFEFQYSNTMLYHDSAPEPELGQGCGCDGPCVEGPRSTCSCLKRQQLYNYDIVNGFAYNKDGTLKESSVPIWECGPNCGCPPECVNRVVQKGRGKNALVDLFKTKKKGWGVKARSDIPLGTFLGIYSGELISEQETERRGLIYEVVGRTYLFDCDGWQIRNPPKGLEAVDPRLAELAYASAARAKQEADENGNDNYNAYSVDAFHYGFTRYFNHSCDPNLAIAQAYVYDYHPERPLLVIFTRKDVRAGEELCISYKGIPDEEEEVVIDYKRNRKYTEKSKTTSMAHVSNQRTAKKNRCYCGAWNCDGTMFPIDSNDSTPV